MFDFERFLKECNLVFTDTAKPIDFCRVDFDSEKEEVNYNDSVNLMTIIEYFNNRYVQFIKEYEELEKINFGESISHFEFSKFKMGEEYRVLVLYIINPTMIKRPYTKLYLREIDGVLAPFITSGGYALDKDYYKRDIKLDKTKSKRYLDLFSKYTDLFKMYEVLQNRRLYSDGTFGINSLIDKGNSNILNGLDKMELSIGATYYNSEYVANIILNLGENFGIDYDNSKFIINDQYHIISNEELDTLLSDTFINKEYTRKLEK